MDIFSTQEKDRKKFVRNADMTSFKICENGTHRTITSEEALNLHNKAMAEKIAATREE